MYLKQFNKTSVIFHDELDGLTALVLTIQYNMFKLLVQCLNVKTVVFDS